jgi:hypothetical protein
MFPNCTSTCYKTYCVQPFQTMQKIYDIFLSIQPRAFITSSSPETIGPLELLCRLGRGHVPIPTPCCWPCESRIIPFFDCLPAHPVQVIQHPIPILYWGESGSSWSLVTCVPSRCWPCETTLIEIFLWSSGRMVMRV